MSFVWKRPEGPLDTEENIARRVHAVSLGKNLDELATVLVLMGIRQESDYWCPWNRKDPTSENYDHDSESNDGRSVAYLQQQNEVAGEVVPPEHDWWGPMWCRMSLECSVGTFLDRLSDDYHSAQSDPYRAAVLIDNVQGSYWNGDPGHPGYYGKHWDYCWSLLRRALDQGPIGPVTPPVKPPQDIPTIDITPQPDWHGDPLYLPDLLRAFGVDVSTYTDSDGITWDQRGHGDFDVISWVLWHHTGSVNETDEGIAHHPSLGLAANMLIHPDGHVTLTGSGVSWNGGVGIYPGIPEDGINQVCIGVECAYSWGPSEPNNPWPEAQLTAMINVGGAISWFLQGTLPPDHQIAHKEWAGADNPLGINKQGKPDPANLDMAWFRDQIAARTAAGPSGVIAQPGEDDYMSNLINEASRSGYRKDNAPIGWGTEVEYQNNKMVHELSVEWLAQLGRDFELGLIVRVAEGKSPVQDDLDAGFVERAKGLVAKFKPSVAAKKRALKVVADIESQG